MIPKRSRRRAAALALVVLSSAALGAESPATDPAAAYDEELTVTATRLPVPLGATGRAVEVLTAAEIARQAVRSLPELLRLFAALDVARRGAFGVQADLAARGSSFEDVLVLVDGVPWNDPQTGHHNLDLPVPVAAIERVELLTGPGSALYGGNASGAVVHIVTRREPVTGTSGEATVLAGQHSLAGGSAEVAHGAHRLNVERSESRGYRRGTEFDQGSVSYQGRMPLPGDGATLGLAAGASSRDFGAWRFYSDRFPNEREETDSRFVALDGAGRLGKGEWRARTALREHEDRFVLDRERTDLAANRHRTRVGDGEIAWRRRLTSFGDIELGLGFRDERLHSSNLGERARNRLNAFAAWTREGKRVDLRGALFVDRVDGEVETHPSLALSVRLGPGHLRAAAASAYRLPSFTELYYRDPATVGNAELAPERSVTVECGYDLVGDRWRLGATLFERRGRDLVDFVRAPGESLFRAVNVRRVDTRGLELSGRLELAHGVDLVLGYSHLDASGAAPEGTSRYVFDYLVDRVTARWSGSGPFALSWGVSTSYGRRRGQRSYATVDLRLARPLPWLGMELFVEGTNLGDAVFRERGGVEMPGRWVWAGISWKSTGRGTGGSHDSRRREPTEQKRVEVSG